MNCTRCHTVIPPDGPAGLCPKCLLSVALGEPEVVVTATGEAAPPPPTPAELQPHFPQFEILRLVGRGGMGAVYEARQKGLARSVALKILAAPTRADSSFEERFVREAQALARLSHENIVAVYDAGRAGPHFFLAMEYVDGPNLRQAERAGHIEPAQALALVVQICAALDYAHKNGIVHRDIKPENVLLTREGQVKIVDFGLAKVLDRAARGLSLTRMSQTMGTPHYMAPEQIEHPKDVDHRADIYSLGVVFYELLTGELPLGRFPLPSQKVSIDVRLDDIVIRTLEKEPDRRYQFAGEVRTAVQDVTSSPRQSAVTAATARLTPARATRERDWRWIAAGCLVLMFCFVIVIGVFIVWGGQRMKGSASEMTVLDMTKSPPSVVTQAPSDWPRVSTEPRADTALSDRSKLDETIQRFLELQEQTKAALDKAKTAAEEKAPQFALALRRVSQDTAKQGDSLDRLQAVDVALRLPQLGGAYEPVRRYLEHEAARTTALPLGDEDEITAVVIEPDARVVASLRLELQHGLAADLAPVVLSPADVEFLLREHMPFEWGPVEVRIARRGGEWIVRRKTTAFGAVVDDFDESLPAAYERLVRIDLARRGPPNDATRAILGLMPPPILDIESARPTRGGELNARGRAWDTARGLVLGPGRALLEQYARIEDQRTRIQQRADEKELARVTVAAFPVVRSTLESALWTFLAANGVSEGDTALLREADFARAAFPFGDHAYTIVVAQGDEGWVGTLLRGETTLSSTYTTGDFPEPYKRMLERCRAAAEDGR